MNRIKRIALVSGILGVLAVPAMASAYSPAYNAVYCYPNGSYWQTQRAAYPAYYQANNAYFLANYGC